MCFTRIRLGIDDVEFMTGGVLVHHEGAPIMPDSFLGKWIFRKIRLKIQNEFTPMMAFNRQTDAFATEWEGGVTRHMCVGGRSGRERYG